MHLQRRARAQRIMKPSTAKALGFSFFTRSRDTRLEKRNMARSTVRSDWMTNDERRGVWETGRRQAGWVRTRKTTERRNQLVAATYQNRVEIVGISLRIRRVDGQRHTVGEDRRQNQILKRSAFDVKSRTRHEHVNTSPRKQSIATTLRSYIRSCTFHHSSTAVLWQSTCTLHYADGTWTWRESLPNVKHGITFWPVALHAHCLNSPTI